MYRATGAGERFYAISLEAMLAARSWQCAEQRAKSCRLSTDVPEVRLPPERPFIELDPYVYTATPCGITAERLG